jgi:hypothetical protein
MTLNDESLLTAYLDGELEPDERLSIESALLDNPALARRLRELTQVHELIAGLPRPALLVDLGAEIGSRIDPNPVRLWPALRGRRLVVAVTATSVLTLAASLLVALGLALRHQPPGPRQVPVSTQPIEIAGDPKSVPSGDHPPASETTPALPRLAQRTSDSAALERKQRDAVAAEKIRALLDSPRLQRVFIVTDVIGGDTPDRVEELVQKTARTEATYGRITVSQGIVIDPLHPQKATVFALVLNEQELRHFQNKLKQSFPDRVEEAEADPIVVAQLAEIGQVSVLPGSPASEVVIPFGASPRIAASKFDLPRQPPLETTQLAPDFGRPDLDTAAGFGGEPGSALRTRAADAAHPAAPRGSDQPRTSGVIADARQGSPVSMPAAVPGAPASGKPPDQPSLLPESLTTINLHEPPQIVLVWVTSP